MLIGSDSSTARCVMYNKCAVNISAMCESLLCRLLRIHEYSKVEIL